MKLEVLKRICKNIIWNDGYVCIDFSTNEEIILEEDKARIADKYGNKDPVVVSVEEAYDLIFENQEKITDIY